MTRELFDPGQRLKLAVLANEFMAPEIGRTGGFGWAARAVARTFQEHPEAGVDVVFLTGEVARNGQREITVHGTRLLLKQRRMWSTLPQLMREPIDLILTIDFRPSYQPLFWMLPRTPVVVWARDPRTPDDVRHIDTLQIPGQERVRPQGIEPIDCTSLARVAKLSRVVGRKVLIASKFPHIADKLLDAYGLTSPHVLPNPDVLDYGALDRSKHPTPRVVFLARLDPYKRPWLYVELAKRLPSVEFLVLGRGHFQGLGSWQPERLPPNVKLVGHVDGEEKVRLLASSWVLVNTSIYEESPVSMLEALACETPIVSCLSTGDIATRFGLFVGSFDGSGMAGLDKFEAALRRLLEDHDERRRLGQEGRAWVMREHSTTRFLECFEALAVLSGARAETRRFS